MVNVLSNKDVLRYLSLWLEPKDICHLGMTCKLLKEKVLENRRLWRYYLVSKFNDIPTENIKDEEVDWKGLSFIQDGGLVRHKLQLFHLVQRLSVTQKDLNYLGLFCKITTKARKHQYRMHDQNLPDIILIREEEEPSIEQEVSIGRGKGPMGMGMGMGGMGGMPVMGGVGFGGAVPPPFAVSKPSSALKVTFSHKKLSSFLFYNGEGNVYSDAVFYAVDRRKPGRMIYLTEKKTNWKQTTLSKKQYAEIGELTKNDKNFYLDGTFAGRYNYSDSHSALRTMEKMEDAYGFGSRTKTSALDLPNVGVTAYTKIEVWFDLEQLHSLFCTKEIEHEGKKQKFDFDDNILI